MQFEQQREGRNLKFEAFSLCFGSLCEAVQPEPLAPMLYQEGLIPMSMISEMLAQTERQRKSLKLMDAVQIRIKLDPEAFDRVLVVLSRERSLEPLVIMLNEKLKYLQTSVVVSPVSSMMPKIQLSGTMSGLRYRRYCLVIYNYLYDAKFLHLHVYTKLCLSSSSMDLKVLGLLGRSISYFFTGRLKRAFRLLKRAIEWSDSPSCVNGVVLRTRAFSCLSSLFKSFGDHRKAREYLKYAREGVALIEIGFDSAVVALQCGCMNAELQRSQEAEAGYSLAMNDHSQDRSLSPEFNSWFIHPQVIIHQKASIALALMYLGCSSFQLNLNYASVSELNIRKAANLLERVEKEIIPRRTMVEYNIARSILYMQQNRVSEALHHASKAADLSSQCGLAGNLQRTPEQLLQFLYDLKKIPKFS